MHFWGWLVEYTCLNVVPLAAAGVQVNLDARSPLDHMREALLSAAALCALVTLLPGAVTWKVGTASSRLNLWH